jgi:acetylornithine/LysW-gamma-L-lysine aminotransferase
VDEQTIVNTENRFGASVYWKLPVTMVRGRGARLWDINGKEYIDCMGGYGVSIVGHSNPRVVEAITKQAEKLITCHGSIYNDTRAELLERLVKIAPSGLERVFLCNTGTESVEAALKLARKHTGKPEIIAMVGSYHGKTMGALSATWGTRYREPFEPLVPGIRFVPFGNPEKVTEAITEKTAAVIVEPIQGEGGIHVAPEGYLKSLREICDQKGVLLIFDEVQTSFGRTGRMWASDHWGVVPDILCVAKAIAGGIPMGAMLAKDGVMSSFKTGDHTSTFGGNPLACAAASATIDFILENHLPERAKELGLYFQEGLRALQAKHRIVREVRGLGLMLALESRFEIQNILLNAVKRGLLLLYCGRTVLRFLPPLVIEKEQITQTLSLLDELLAEEERARLPPKIGG